MRIPTGSAVAFSGPAPLDLRRKRFSLLALLLVLQALPQILQALRRRCVRHHLLEAGDSSRLT